MFRRTMIVLALVCAACVAAPAYGQATTVRDRVVVPFALTITACSGEDVSLAGELLLMSQTTTDARGGLHAKFTLVPQHVRGVGSVTGTEYKAIGGHRESFSADSDFAPLNFTLTDMFNLVSQGGTGNLQLRLTLHTTIDANGRMTAAVEDISEKCVG